MDLLEINVRSLSEKEFHSYGSIIYKSKNNIDFSNDLINIYSCVDKVELYDGDIQICLLEVKWPRRFICEKLECHKKCNEIFIPMNGQSLFVVARSDNEGNPDFGSLKVFYLDCTRGLCIKPQIWHWIPFPLFKNVYFTLITRKQTAKDDLEIIDLNKNYSQSIKLKL